MVKRVSEKAYLIMIYADIGSFDFSHCIVRTYKPKINGIFEVFSFKLYHMPMFES